MTDLLNTDILEKTFDDLSHGVGIFQVPDLNDIKSIRYVFMNKVLLYEMRKKREEVFGKRIIEVAPEAFEHEVGLQVIETYRKVAAEGGIVNLGLVQYSNHLVAGTYDCSVHHIQDNYVYVLLRNVTELEQLKNKLEQKNKELGEFVQMVTHDLKEPLRSISGFTTLLEKKYRGQLDKKADQFINFITDATARMKNLIDDLLAYSKLESKKEKTTVDCHELVKVVLQDLQSLIKETNATIKVEELPKVKGFETELRLLFQNLITNGIKFSKDGVSPKIMISSKQEESLTFSIQDDGIGIADEHKAKIFNIFQRLHTRDEYEGTGIGLAHCKKIVEMHEGEIWVKSKPGEGSTFYFTIPN